MALFFTLFVMAIILGQIPIFKELMVVVMIILALWLVIAVGARYQEIQEERAARTEIRR